VSCDVTVAADDCLFGAPEVRFGSGIVAMVLPWLIAPKLAKELLLTGDDRVSARRALEMGLVNRVVPAADVLDEARAVAVRDTRVARVRRDPEARGREGRRGLAQRPRR
jgi:enoyl-CoA hydratase/carnithine racemase